MVAHLIGLWNFIFTPLTAFEKNLPKLSIIVLILF